jgi:hypothetical protein
MIRHLTAAMLLAGLSFSPALAQEETASVDLVAAVFIGFGDGAKVQVGGSETAVITKAGPGTYSGESSDGTAFTFAATEPAACSFEGRFERDGEVFTIAFDASKIETITFRDSTPMDGFTQYLVVLTGPDGMVETINEDGSRGDGGKQSPIGTSLTQAELDTAAASLLERC